eukprot:2384440-Alexandrium_andersonii.AAC.1
MPTHLHAGWDVLCSGHCRGPRELVARETCRWIDTDGPALGFRVPSVAERSRALGMETVNVSASARAGVVRLSHMHRHGSTLEPHAQSWQCA